MTWDPASRTERRIELRRERFVRFPSQQLYDQYGLYRLVPVTMGARGGEVVISTASSVPDMQDS